MPREGIAKVWRRLRRLVDAPDEAVASDGQLLERFTTQHDEAAFVALVERHGPLVQGTCRRVLRDSHAAEDAFQAVFLVLAQRAAALERRPSLAGWLHGVAFRIALRARFHAMRRRVMEQPMIEPDKLATADPSTDTDRREIEEFVDAEVQRLPARYREPLVLCYLQGKTNEQAALDLGQPAGSISRYLKRARELLRERLVRRGVVAPAVLVGPALAEAAVGPLATQMARAALLVAAGRSAAAVTSAEALCLASDFVRAPHLNKLKLAITCLLCVLVIGLAGTVAFVMRSTDPGPGSIRGELPAGDLPDKQADSGLKTLAIRHATSVSALALSPDGRALATLTGRLHVWDTASGQQLGSWQNESHETRHLLFSPDGTVLAAWEGRYGKVRLFAVPNLELLVSWEEHPPRVMLSALAVAPGGAQVACGYTDGTILLWDGKTGKRLVQLTSNAQVNRLAFSPNGKRLAAGLDMWREQPDGGVGWPGGENNNVSVWDVQTQKMVLTCCGHPLGVCAIAFAHDGRSLASLGKNDEHVRIWEMATGQQRTSWTVPDVRRRHGYTYIDPLQNSGLVFAADGETVATLRGTEVALRLTDLTTGRDTTAWKSPGLWKSPVSPAWLVDLAFSKSGKPVAAAIPPPGSGRTVVVWDPSRLETNAHPLLEGRPVQEQEALWAELPGKDEDDYYSAAFLLAELGSERLRPFLSKLTTGTPAQETSWREAIALYEERAERSPRTLPWSEPGPWREALEALAKGPVDFTPAAKARAALRRLSPFD